VPFATAPSSSALIAEPLNATVNSLCMLAVDARADHPGARIIASSMFASGKCIPRGIYVIWEMLDPTRHQRVTRVGQTRDLSQRIKQHRSTWGWGYRDRDLRVTWARVEDSFARNRVEEFLAYKLHPRIGERFPRRGPLAVNVPFLL
jgi:hypothetical protein